MSTVAKVVVALACLIVSGCSNLSEVAKFANDSAIVAGNMSWINGYQDQLERKRLVAEPSTVAKLEQEKLVQKKEADDLREIHGRVEAYMQSLAAMADPDVAQLLPAASGMRSSITAHPTIGIDATVVNSFFELGDVLYSGLTHLGRQQKLKETIRRGEPDIQKLIGSLKTAADKYNGSLQTELAQANRVFNLERFGDVGPAKPALLAFGKVLADEKRRAIVQQQAEVARQKLTLEQVALGHTQLHENIERLQAKDVVQSLLGYRRKMRDIQRTLADELAQFR